MPRMHCHGTSIEVPSNGKICPKLPTNIVPKGHKCEITCDSGTPSAEYIKCGEEGWSAKEVTCSGSSAGLIVGLLVGGILVICIIAYVYARVKTRKRNQKEGNAKKQPVSRAAKIAAKNDMVVTGVVTRDMVRSGMVSVPQQNKGKLVTGIEDEDTNFRRSSSSSRNLSNPPSYHSNDSHEKMSYDAGSRSGNGRKSRVSSSEVSSQRKPRNYYNEYPIELDYHEESAMPSGKYQMGYDDGAMYPDYYPTTQQSGRQPYSGGDSGYYNHDMQDYRYTNGGREAGRYSQRNYSHKPYHLPM